MRPAANATSKAMQKKTAGGSVPIVIGLGISQNSAEIAKSKLMRKLRRQREPRRINRRKRRRRKRRRRKRKRRRRKPEKGANAEEEG